MNILHHSFKSALLGNEIGEIIWQRLVKEISNYTNIGQEILGNIITPSLSIHLLEQILRISWSTTIIAQTLPFSHIRLAKLAAKRRVNEDGNVQLILVFRFRETASWGVVRIRNIKCITYNNLACHANVQQNWNRVKFTKSVT